MPTIAIHDAATGETSNREMTEEELAQYEADKATAPEYSQEKTPTDEAPASDDAGAPSTDAG